jgi:hypothetical protein
MEFAIFAPRCVDGEGRPTREKLIIFRHFIGRTVREIRLIGIDNTRATELIAAFIGVDHASRLIDRPFKA